MVETSRFLDDSIYQTPSAGDGTSFSTADGLWQINPDFESAPAQTMLSAFTTIENVPLDTFLADIKPESQVQLEPQAIPPAPDDFGNIRIESDQLASQTRDSFVQNAALGNVIAHIEDPRNAFAHREKEALLKDIFYLIDKGVVWSGFDPRTMDATSLRAMIAYLKDNVEMVNKGDSLAALAVIHANVSHQMGTEPVFHPATETTDAFLKQLGASGQGAGVKETAPVSAKSTLFDNVTYTSDMPGVIVMIDPETGAQYLDVTGAIQLGILSNPEYVDNQQARDYFEDIRNQYAGFPSAKTQARRALRKEKAKNYLHDKVAPLTDRKDKTELATELAMGTTLALAVSPLVTHPSGLVAGTAAAIVAGQVLRNHFRSKNEHVPVESSEVAKSRFPWIPSSLKHAVVGAGVSLMAILGSGPASQANAPEIAPALLKANPPIEQPVGARAIVNDITNTYTAPKRSNFVTLKTEHAATPETKAAQAPAQNGSKPTVKPSNNKRFTGPTGLA